MGQTVREVSVSEVKRSPGRKSRGNRKTPKYLCFPGGGPPSGEQTTQVRGRGLISVPAAATTHGVSHSLHLSGGGGAFPKSGEVKN